jgi:hypothetical protein
LTEEIKCIKILAKEPPFITFIPGLVGIKQSDF